MSDRRDYSELIAIISELKSELKIEIAGVVNEVNNLKEGGIPLSKVKLGVKEACIIFAWLVICVILPGSSGYFLNVNKNNQQDMKIESLEERQEILYGREHDELGAFNIN